MSQESPNNPDTETPADDRLGPTNAKAATAAALVTAPVAASDTIEEPYSVLSIRRFDRVVGFLEQVLLAFFLLVLIGIGVTQAVAIKFGIGLGVWSFELLRYSVFFIAMTGAALSAHTGQLIAMDFVTRLLDRRRRAHLRVVLRLFTVAICGLLFKGGMALTGSVSSSGDAIIEPGVGLMALPVGAALIGLHVTLHLVIDLIYLTNGELPPESNEPFKGGH